MNRERADDWLTDGVYGGRVACCNAEFERMIAESKVAGAPQ